VKKRKRKLSYLQILLHCSHLSLYITVQCYQCFVAKDPGSLKSTSLSHGESVKAKKRKVTPLFAEISPLDRKLVNRGRVCGF
jgi:hypothetical protein